MVMNTQPSKLSKILGSGPIGVLVSFALLLIANWLNEWIDPIPLSENRLILDFVFLASILMTLAMIIWSVKSLPASERGNKLSTRGAFRYVRHPLYAAFLSIFDFGLAVYLNSYIFIVWAIILHPVWHYIVRYEERMMVTIFGQSYVEYQRTTGRFFPRFRKRNRGDS